MIKVLRCRWSLSSESESERETEDREKSLILLRFLFFLFRFDQLGPVHSPLGGRVEVGLRRRRRPAASPIHTKILEMGPESQNGTRYSADSLWKP